MTQPLLFSCSRTDRALPHPILQAEKQSARHKGAIYPKSNDRFGFIAQTSYTLSPAMLTYMTVEPPDTYPKKFHVSRETHVTLIACGISHAHVKVIKIRFPV